MNRNLMLPEHLPQHFPIGVKLRFFNYNLDRAIRAKGWTREEAAKALKIALNTLYQWLRFAFYPSEEARLRASIALEVPEEHIFPVGLSGFRLKRQPEAFAITSDDVDQMRIISDDGDLSQLFLREAISRGLESLTPREALVLRHRFGLEAEEAQSLRAVGDMMGVTPERVRQIEAKGLRKLRHPYRAGPLRGFLKGENIEDERLAVCCPIYSHGEKGVLQEFHTYHEAEKAMGEIAEGHLENYKYYGRPRKCEQPLYIKSTLTSIKWEDGKPQVDESGPWPLGPREQKEEP
ncbi:hypothetical protein CMI37_28840 [Candidatus Pacearchaeota archaeon]|nr:hypothetical protein [Candidatus Pacearchaeota archaeon]|tara:strand:+ start:2769 stop:3644 length:876 start_codon:yes stop_codon:yes gene_type:complete